MTTTGTTNGIQNNEINPFITVTKATPPQSSAQSSSSTSITLAKSNRLLYRGSLALPDSEMMLEGISFITDASISALSSSSIPLTLESQRNRSLKFIGAVEVTGPNKLGGALDFGKAVRMYVHPLAKLSVSFFEMLFCTREPNHEGVSEMAVRVGLGDTCEHS